MDRVEETNNNSGDRVIDLSMGSKKPSERVSVSSGKREIFYTLLYSLWNNFSSFSSFFIQIFLDFVQFFVII